jgi:hypothetical protein
MPLVRNLSLNRIIPARQVSLGSSIRRRAMARAVQPVQICQMTVAQLEKTFPGEAACYAHLVALCSWMAFFARLWWFASLPTQNQEMGMGVSEKLKW